MILVSYILLKNIKEHSENTSEKKKIIINVQRAQFKTPPHQSEKILQHASLFSRNVTAAPQNRTP